jgi:hypothetical protein
MPWQKTGNIKGPIGETGQAAFTLSTQDFEIPPVGETVEVGAENTDWVAIGEWVYIGISEEDCIAFQVTDKTVSSVTLLNSPSSVGIPGPPGEVGRDGVPAYTNTIQDFTVPEVGQTVDVEVGNTDWIAVGEVLWVAEAGGTGIAGTLEVQSKTDTSLTLVNSPILIGPTGPAGEAATIEVGETITLVPGVVATVENVGTPQAAIFNFGIPEGIKGDKGDKGDVGDVGPPSFADAPSDGIAYGRQDAAWTKTVKLSGDTMTGNLIATGFFAKGGGWCGVSNQVNPGWYLASGNDYRYDGLTLFKLDATDRLKIRYHNASGTSVFDADLFDTYHSNIQSRGDLSIAVGATLTNRGQWWIESGATVSWKGGSNFSVWSGAQGTFENGSHLYITNNQGIAASSWSIFTLRITASASGCKPGLAFHDSPLSNAAVLYYEGANGKFRYMDSSGALHELANAF